MFKKTALVVRVDLPYLTKFGVQKLILKIDKSKDKKLQININGAFSGVLFQPNICGRDPAPFWNP